jgi:hypothetical protein
MFILKNLNIEGMRTGSIVILYLKKRKKANFRFFLNEGQKTMEVLPLLVDTGGNLAASVLTPVANLPLVSLIPVVHLDLRMSPQIFEKI